MLDETHDPAAASWIASAQSGNGFPLQNLPFASFRPRGSGEDFRIGVAIGDRILDLRGCEGLPDRDLLAGPTLNAFLALDRARWKAFRLHLFRALREGAPESRRWGERLVPARAVEFALPAQIGDYTDFYTSVHHATRIGRLFRPDNPLLPNYKWVPIGYHGRASTIGVSGTDFHRPRGQTMPPGAESPQLTPSRRLDYELELGLVVGTGNTQGEAIAIGEAGNHVFGVCLLNDWSARDIQAWEYQPLGPFLSKNFATTISPWIVTMEALAPFRTAWTRPDGDPQPLSYLDSPEVRTRGAVDIQLEALIETPRMRAAGDAPRALGRTSYRHAYWTPEQLVAHHTVNGCRLRPGDLLGTGTLSGPDDAESGSLVELTRGGKTPIRVGAEQRTFLEDGDRVILRGWCEKPGTATISLGEASATVLPAGG